MIDHAIPDVIASREPWVLETGSCLDPARGLARLRDECIDVAIMDPPYSEHVHQSCMSGVTASNRVGERGEFAARKELGFEHITVREMEDVADQLARLVRRWVLVFSDVESAHLWRGALTSARLEYVRTGAWVKHGGAPQFTGDRPAVGFEAIIIAHRPGRKRWNGGGKAGVWTSSIVLGQRGEERVHPTQKPVGLLEALLRDFTDPGDLVLDPFAGSGTTGVAARTLGRRFIGWELDEAHAAVARTRIAGAVEQPGLFAMDAFRKEARKKRKQTALALAAPSREAE